MRVCGSAYSTWDPTPSTCSWWTHTAVPRRFRRTRTRPSCGWPSTWTRTARSRSPGSDGLVAFVKEAAELAEDKGCESVLSFATSALREAPNGEKVLDRVRKETGVDLQVLSGEDEARLTFLAVRRWFGWSSGRLAVFDIGGGSLEIAAGSDEEPTIAVSVPLGAGRLTREGADRRPAGQGRGPGAAEADPDRDGRGGRSAYCGPASRSVRSPPARRSGRWPGSAARRRRTTDRTCRGRWTGTT